MKFLAVFVAVLAVSSAYAPIASWTLHEITAALEDPSTDPALLPPLIEGLNTLMASLHAGHDQHTVLISLPLSEEVTLEQLSASLQNPNVNPAYVPYLENALNELMKEIVSGSDVNTITLNIPPMQVNVWSLNQISYALSSPDLDPELQIYLEHALNELMQQLFDGSPVAEIAVITPPGVITVLPQPAIVPEVPVLPEPVIVDPIVEEPPAPVVLPPIVEPTPVQPPTPVVQPPAPVVQPPTPVAPEAPSSPLVQIIVNVNAQGSAPAPVAPVPVSPVVVPEATEEEPIIAIGPWPVGPTPVEETEEPIIAVGPWGPIVPPSPVVIDNIEQPIIAIGPWGPHNPAPVNIEQPILAVGPWA